MSADDTRVVPTRLLEAVREEVDDLKGQVAFYRDLAETLEAQRDALRDAAPGEAAAGDQASLFETDAAADERAALEADLAESQADLARSRAEQAQAEAERDAALEVAADAQAERDQMASELGRARLDATRARAERDELARTHPLPPRLRRRLADGTAADPHEAVAAAFVGWCRRDSPLRSRSYLFEAFVREAGRLPDARVSPVYRSADRLHADGAGPEYWLVRADGLSVVVPQPVRRDAFAELHASVMAGSATPDMLAHVSLADVRLTGVDVDVLRPGEVSA